MRPFGELTEQMTCISNSELIINVPSIETSGLLRRMDLRSADRVRGSLLPLEIVLVRDVMPVIPHSIMKSFSSRLP
jgi:hypothetical protein